MRDFQLIIKTLFRFILPVLCILTLVTIIKFTQLHVIYFPEEIPAILIGKEYYYLFSSLVIFILSMYYKFKISMIISFACIVLSLINITGFSIAAVFYYKELHLDQFI